MTRNLHQGSLFDGPGGTVLEGMDEPASLEEALDRGDLEFNGAEYEEEYDQARLTGQIFRVYEVMRDGEWRTLEELGAEMALKFGRIDPLPSVSAQLRHLRKRQFGGYCVEKRARGKREHGLFEYRVVEGSGA